MLNIEELKRIYTQNSEHPSNTTTSLTLPIILNGFIVIANDSLFLAAYGLRFSSDIQLTKVMVI